MQEQDYLIETSRENKNIRISSSGVRTIKDLKIKISQQLEIPQQNIRLLLNNTDLQVADHTSIHQLNIKPTDKLKAIRKNPKNLQPTTFQNNLQQVNVFLRNKCITRIAHRLMQSKIINSNISKLTSTNGMLQFIVQKLSSYTPAFSHLLQNNNRELLKLTQNWFHIEATNIQKQTKQQQNQYVNNLSKLTSPHLISTLSKLVPKKRAQQILQMTQNDVKWATEVVCRGEQVLKESGFVRMNDRELKMVSRLAEWQEQPFIFRWLNAPANLTLRIQIYAFPQFLDVFILSVSHLNESLYNLLLRNRQYILDIIRTCPPPLTIN